MRSEEQILALLLSVAKKDERIRAVILNGSRTNQKVPKDKFRDFDIIFLVEELNSFKADQDWIEVFGERIIMQMPNSMKIDENDLESTKEQITYLMLFKDHNRIDLTLIETQNKEQCRDSLNKILLDKDNLLDPTPNPSDVDYLIVKPTQKEFNDICNEFWWVATYVIKGLARKETLYAKDMLEGPVRKMFMRMLGWYAGSQNDFSINLGASNRFLEQYVSPAIWHRILKTYPGSDIETIWKSLVEMTDLFHEIGLETAENIGLTYNSTEAGNVKAYMEKIRKLTRG